MVIKIIVSCFHFTSLPKIPFCTAGHIKSHFSLCTIPTPTNRNWEFQVTLYTATKFVTAESLVRNFKLAAWSYLLSPPIPYTIHSSSQLSIGCSDRLNKQYFTSQNSKPWPQYIPNCYLSFPFSILQQASNLTTQLVTTNPTAQS